MKWAIDPTHSSVTFTIRQLMSKVRGEMKIKEGWIETENEDFSRAGVEVVLDAATVTITAPPVTLTLSNYPVTTFKSKRVEAKDPSSIKVIGDLTIHGITREVTLRAGFNGEGTDSSGNRRIGFSADGSLSRKAFNLTWNQALEAGGFIFGDNVKLDIDVEAVPATAQAGATSKTEPEAALAAR
jgi:polyisoprenoid-binding protein YceI